MAKKLLDRADIAKLRAAHDPALDRLEERRDDAEWRRRGGRRPSKPQARARPVASSILQARWAARHPMFVTVDELFAVHGIQDPDPHVRLVHSAGADAHRRDHVLAPRAVAAVAAIGTGLGVGLGVGLGLNAKFPGGVNLPVLGPTRPSVPLAVGSFLGALLARRYRMERTLRAAAGAGVGATIASVVPVGKK